MNLRLLGVCAIIGAPFLLIVFLTYGSGSRPQHAEWDGLYSLLYISGWMCSIAGLWHSEAAGTNRWSRIVLLVQLMFLSLANISNLMSLFKAGLDTKFYFILDMFWPISNVWMLATGITVMMAKRLNGWSRYVPLVVGLWLPISILLTLTFGKTSGAMWLSGLYAAGAWAALGVVVFRLSSARHALKLHHA